jgi:hypothetical protein
MLHASQTPAHASVQQTPSTQVSVAEQPPPHGAPWHPPHFEPPQSFPVSFPFCALSSQLTQVCVDRSQLDLSPMVQLESRTHP